MRFKFSGYKSVWALIAINTLMFIVTTIRPDIGDSMALTKPFLNSNYWTILTSIFVHANFLHIFSNMLALYFFGTFCLQLIDDKWFWVVYWKPEGQSTTCLHVGECKEEVFISFFKLFLPSFRSSEA